MAVNYTKAHIVLVGDSIAVTFRNEKPFGLVPHVDLAVMKATPADVLKQIKGVSYESTPGSGGLVSGFAKNQMKGGVVVLSTGISSDSKNTKDVEAQFKRIQDSGAIAVYILGANGKKVSEIKALAIKAGLKIPVYGTDSTKGFKNDPLIKVLAENILDSAALGAKSSSVATLANQQKAVEDAKANGNVLPTTEFGSLRGNGPVTLEDKLLAAKELFPLLRERGNRIDARNNNQRTIVTRQVDDALKGVTVQIDAARGFNFPSMKWLGEFTKEDQAMYSKFNDNYINNFVGYGYPDLRMEEAFGKEYSNTIEPTFFIEADPVVKKEDVAGLLEHTSKVALDQFKEAAGRGFWDKALGVGIDSNAINEANDEHGFNAFISNKLKEKSYIPVEAVTNTELGQSTKTNTPEGEGPGTGYDGSHDGLNSTYTGKFPTAYLEKALGPLQKSQGLGIMSKYPPRVRAFADLISRHEGTHEAKGALGYRTYYGYAFKLDLNKKHPNIPVKGGGYTSTAAGRYQALYGTWTSVMKGNPVMSIANQDLFMERFLKNDLGKIWGMLTNNQTSWKEIWTYIKTYHPKKWTSVPNKWDVRESAQHSKLLSGKEWVEAAMTLQKFYEGAGVGERSTPRTQGGTVTSDNPTVLDKIKQAGSPTVLDTESKGITYTLNHNLETYGFFYSNDAAAKQFQTNKLEFYFVQALTGNTYILKSNTKTPKYIMVRLKNFKAPNMEIYVKFRGGNNKHGKYKKEKVPTEFGRPPNQIYGIESRNIANRFLENTIVTLDGTLKKGPTDFLLYIEDLKVGGVSVSKSMITFGGGLPPVKGKSKELEAAQKSNNGIWSYQAGAIYEDQVNGYNFADMTAIDGKIESKIKNAIGLTPKKAQVINNEKGTKAVVEKEQGVKTSVANNAYTASSKPVRLATETKKEAEKKSLKRCALYVRKALDRSGYKVVRQPSAYMFHSTGALRNGGFAQIPLGSTLMPGDIVVINRGVSNHGHIVVFGTDGKWYSDFDQGSKANPYKTNKIGAALYRDKEFLAVTNVQEVKEDWKPISGLGAGGVAVTSVNVPGDTENAQYVEETKRLGVYPDLSNYTIEQVEGHKYEDIEIDDSYSVFGMEAKKEQHVKKLMHNYERGLNLCFPVIKAYVVLGNEDDDLFVEGVPLIPATYYELPPIQAFNLECNNEYNPLDVCVFSCINPAGMRSMPGEQGILQDPEMVGTQWFNTTIQKYLTLSAGTKIHIRAGYSNDPNKLKTIFNGIIKETSGSRDFMIECVCESYASELLAQQLGPAEPTNFAGDHNASTGLLFGYSMLAENINHFGARLDSKFHLGTAIVGSIVKPLAVVGLAAKFPLIIPLATVGVLSLSLLKYFGYAINERDIDTDVGKGEGELGPEGISYMNTVNGQSSRGFWNTFFGDNILNGKGRLGDFRDPENKAMVAPFSAGNYLWNMFNLSRANLTQRVYSNIYAASVEAIHGEFRDSAFSRYSAILSFNRKFRYKFYVTRSTVWVVLKEMEYRHPGTVSKPLWFEERQTLFYGTKEQCYIARDLDPYFMNRAGQHARYNASNKPYVDFYTKERKKRFDTATGYHYFSTKTNVISSNIKLNRQFATKINSVFFEDKWAEGVAGFNEKSDTILLDKTLRKADIREKTISLGGTHGSYMSWMYGTQELKKELETMYDGSIIITGDPTVKAGDYAYISDTNRGISGTIKIRECSHHFSADGGYTTIIKPGLFVEATHFMWDDFFLRMNLALAALDVKINLNQDISLGGSQTAADYHRLLTLIQDNHDISTGTYLYKFAGIAAIGAITAYSLKSLAFTINTISGKHGATIKAGWAYAKSYASTGGSELWKWSKGLAKAGGDRVKQANARVIAQMIRQNPANAKMARIIGERGLTALNTTKMAWAKTARLRSTGSMLGRLAWTVSSRLFALVLAHPITAIVAAVGGLFVAWALSAVRRMKLLHNAITFFPLQYNGKPYVAGVTGWSGKGEWEAFRENMRRNAKTLQRAARMINSTTTSLDVNGSLKTNFLAGMASFLGGAAGVPDAVTK